MAWRWQQTWLGLKAENLIFLDESGSNKAMAPRYGYALKGERSQGAAPRKPRAQHLHLSGHEPRGHDRHHGHRGSY